MERCNAVLDLKDGKQMQCTFRADAKAHFIFSLSDIGIHVTGGKNVGDEFYFWEAPEYQRGY